MYLFQNSERVMWSTSAMKITEYERYTMGTIKKSLQTLKY